LINKPRLWNKKIHFSVYREFPVKLVNFQAALYLSTMSDKKDGKTPLPILVIGFGTVGLFIFVIIRSGIQISKENNVGPVMGVAIAVLILIVVRSLFK
jgi:hypothetical protein